MQLNFVGKGDAVCTHLAHDELQSMHISMLSYQHVLSVVKGSDGV